MKRKNKEAKMMFFLYKNSCKPQINFKEFEPKNVLARQEEIKQENLTQSSNYHDSINCFTKTEKED